MNNRNWFCWIAVFLCSALLLARSQAQSRPAADLIVTNAKVWTVDKSVASAQAVAVLEERIVAVGSSAEVDAWRGPRTQVIDAGGEAAVARIQRCASAFRIGRNAAEQCPTQRRYLSAGIRSPYRRARQDHAQGRVDSGGQLGRDEVESTKSADESAY